MPNEVLTRAIDAVASGTDLSAEQAQEVLGEIMAGEVGEAQTAAFLIALRAKGETVEELTGLARTMRELAVPVDGGRRTTCSTPPARAAGCRPSTSRRPRPSWPPGAGCCVAKHGNRSATSRCGSADLLEALGRASTSTPTGVARCIDDVGFGFMFAPAHHQAMRHVVPVRKALGVRTIFNFLGPLTNPAGATRQLIGVVDPGIHGADRRRARAARRATRAGRVSGTTASTSCRSAPRRAVIEVTEEGTRAYTVSPEDVGLERAAHEDVAAAARRERRHHARRARGRAWPGARWWCSTPAPRCWWPGARRSRRGYGSPSRP